MADKRDLLLCQFCGKGSEIEEVAGQMHAEEAESGKIVSAHHRCMQYASALAQYKSDEFGGFDVDEVEKEINRGKKLRCHVCKLTKVKICRGASCGCAVRSCRRTFHYPCAFSDPYTITKRLVVTTNKNSDSKEKFVYYRVFCSKEHEVAFRETLREELRDNKTKRRRRDISDHEEDDSQDEEEEMDSTSLTAGPQTESVSGTGQNESAYLTPPPVEPKSLSPGHRLLLSFASNHSRNEAGETSNNSPTKRIVEETPAIQKGGTPASQKGGIPTSQKGGTPASQKDGTPASQKGGTPANQKGGTPASQKGGTPASQKGGTPANQKGGTPANQKGGTPFQVLAMTENQRGAANATVIVHSNSNQRGAEEEPPQIPDSSASEADDSIEVESFLVTPARSTRSSTKLADSHEPLTENLSVVIPDIVSDRSLRRSPRKIVDQSNNAKNSPNGVNESVRLLADSVTPQPSPHPLSLNSPHTRQTRQQAAKEHTPQNGIGGDVLSDSISELDSSHESLRSSTRPLRSRKADVRNDTQAAVSQNASPSPGLVEKSSSKQVDGREASKSDGLSDMSKQSRKRKVGEAEDGRNVSSPSTSKSRKNDESTVPASLASVLLIPNSMGEFKRRERLVMDTAAEAMKVKASNVCVWQVIVKKSLPSDLLVFFLLELVKELKNDNSETLLNLLFDEEYVAARENIYVAQAKVLHSLNDEKSQKDVQKAIWGGLERNVKDLPMVRVLRLPDHDLMTLAIDVHQCNDSRRVQAYLQAHKGLSWWDEDTELASLNLSPALKSVAAQAEVWTWQVWLTKVCPVSEVTVLPSDSYLHDKAGKANSPELQRLLQSLKDSTNSRSGKGLLLIFQHVDKDVVNFQQYFRKVCMDILQSRTSGSALALVPLDNLHNKSYGSVCGLMGDNNNKNAARHAVTIRSAFSPQFHLTKLVLLEITTN